MLLIINRDGNNALELRVLSRSELRNEIQLVEFIREEYIH